MAMAPQDGTGFEAQPAAFSARMALGFSAHFLFVGLYLPYFPVWLESKALTPAEIGIVLSVAMVVRVLASAQVTGFADRFRDRAVLLTRLHCAAAAAILLFLLTGSFWPILLAATLFSLFFNPILPLLDAIALAGVRRFDADYGKIRIWGSIVFILANLAGGWLLTHAAPDAMLHALIGCAVLAAVLSFAIPRIGRKTLPAAASQAMPTWRSLAADRHFLLVLSACALGQASHALLYGFGTIYWQAAGFTGLAIGLFWAIGVIAEIILFHFSKRMLKHLSAITMIAIGCAGGALRWLMFPLTGGEAGFLALQVLHGLSFGAVHIGTMHFIMDSVPEERLGTGQGIGFVLGGIAMGAGIALSGPLYQAAGVQGFWAMAVVCVVALLLLGLAIADRRRNAA